MAEQSFNPEDPQTIKLWSKTLAYETFARTWSSKLIGKSDNSIIQIKNDTSRSAGDEVKCFIRMLPQGEGILGDNILEGSEEGLSFFEFKFRIDQLRHAFAYKGRMSQQRVTFNIQQQCKNALRDWWAIRRDREVFTQLCGYTGGQVIERGETYAGDNLAYTGRNPTFAPSAGNHFFVKPSTDASKTGEALVAADFTATGVNANSSAAQIETFLNTASDYTFDVNVLNDMVYKATTMSPLMRPASISDGEFRGENMFVLIIDAAQARDLRKDLGEDKWRGIYRDAMQGGKTSKNPIFDGSIGIFNNVIIHKSNRICPGVDANGNALKNVRRAVFLGAQAGVTGFGQKSSINSYEWVQEPFDYKDKRGIAAGNIAGVSKVRYNNNDFGTLVCSTHANT